MNYLGKHVSLKYELSGGKMKELDFWIDFLFYKSAYSL